MLVLTLPLEEQVEVSIESIFEARIAASSQSGALVAEDLGEKNSSGLDKQNKKDWNQATKQVENVKWKKFTADKPGLLVPLETSLAIMQGLQVKEVKDILIF